jgi:hypothetical protein
VERRDNLRDVGLGVGRLYKWMGRKLEVTVGWIRLAHDKAK